MNIISVQSPIVNLNLSYNHITNISLTSPLLAVNNMLPPRWICISGTQSTSDTSHVMQAVLIDNAPFWNFTLKPILIVSNWYVTARSTGHIFTHNRQYTVWNTKILPSHFSIHLPPRYSSAKDGVITFGVTYYTLDNIESGFFFL